MPVHTACESCTKKNLYVRKVVQCRREDLAQHIGHADMAVPLMARVDEPILALAPRLKCILQYGVGVEGIDIPAVRSVQCPADIYCSGKRQCHLAVAETSHCISACLQMCIHALDGVMECHGAGVAEVHTLAPCRPQRAASG